MNTLPPRSPATILALRNHEQVHRMTMTGIDNAARIALFRAAFENDLAATDLTDREVISAMCAVELECYS